MLQAGTGTQEKLVELQHDGFARDAYSEINLCEIFLYDVQLVQKDCYACYSSIVAASISTAM